MKTTWADINKAQKILGWQPQVSLEEGIKRAVEWTKNNWELVHKREKKVPGTKFVIKVKKVLRSKI